MSDDKTQKGNRIVIKEVSFNLPFGIGGVKWEVDQTQSRAAWSLYVELVTRIAVEPLKADQGLVLLSLSNTVHAVLTVLVPPLYPAFPPQDEADLFLWDWLTGAVLF